VIEVVVVVFVMAVVVLVVVPIVAAVATVMEVVVVFVVVVVLVVVLIVAAGGADAIVVLLVGVVGGLGSELSGCGDLGSRGGLAQPIPLLAQGRASVGLSAPPSIPPPLDGQRNSGGARWRVGGLHERPTWHSEDSRRLRKLRVAFVVAPTNKYPYGPQQIQTQTN
jgi:hypothetical protein